MPHRRHTLFPNVAHLEVQATGLFQVRAALAAHQAQPGVQAAKHVAVAHRPTGGVLMAWVRAYEIGALRRVLARLDVAAQLNQ